MSKPSSPVPAYLVMAVTDALGSGMFLPVATLSLTVLMGVPVAQAGVVVTAGTVAGLLVGLVAGPAMRWLRAGQLLVGSLLLRAGAMAGYALLNGVVGGLVVTGAGRIGSTLGRPASTVLAAQVVPEDRQLPLLARSYSMRNVAIGVGASAAALVVAGLDTAGYSVLVAVNALSYLVAAALARHLTRSWTAAAPPVPDAAPGSGTGKPTGPPARRVRVRDLIADRAFLRVIASLTVLSTQSALLSVAVPLWLLLETARSRAGVLAAGAVVLNTALVAVLQVRMSRNARSPVAATRLLRASGLLFAAGCLAPLLKPAGLPLLAALVAATVLITIAEMLLTAGGWGAALGFAPKDQPEMHVAATSWAQGLGEALAAATVGTLAPALGNAGWLATAAVFLVPVALLPWKAGEARPLAVWLRRRAANN